MTAATAPFRIDLTPTPEDIDDLGHVNNAVYVRWLQEVATAHWYAFAPADIHEKCLWVVLRHEIDYRRPSHLGEALVAETQTENPAGARFDRRTRILGPDGSLRVAALTTWALLDIRTRRPMRVPRIIVEMFSAR